MMIGNLAIVGLLAMAPNWAVVDIPYPEAGGSARVTRAGRTEIVYLELQGSEWKVVRTE
jgi:hypothetical protein